MRKRNLLQRLSGSLASIADHIIRRIQDSARAARVRRAMDKMSGSRTQLYIQPNANLRHADHITVGNNVSIGEHCHIMAYGGLEIGDNVIISRDVTIYCSDHPFSDSDLLPFGLGRVSNPVSIGDNVWIGMHARILPGTTIGEGAIVGMGAIVSGIVPPLAIVGQPKFRIIGHRDQAAYDKSVQDGQFRRNDGSMI